MNHTCLSRFISHEPYIIWLLFKVHLCKMMISRLLFHFVKIQSDVLYISSYYCHLWYTSVKWWYRQVFFPFFSKFWFLRLLVGKRAKKAQNDKKFCLLCSISQEYHIIWLSLVLHKYKMMISPCVVFSIFFKILIFQLVSGIKGKKKQPKMTKNSVALHISGIKHIIIICGTQI